MTTFKMLLIFTLFFSSGCTTHPGERFDNYLKEMAFFGKQKVKIEFVNKSAEDEKKLIMVFKITNLSNVDIKAFKGLLIFKDLFNDDIYRTPVKIYE